MIERIYLRARRYIEPVIRVYKEKGIYPAFKTGIKIATSTTAYYIDYLYYKLFKSLRYFV